MPGGAGYARTGRHLSQARRRASTPANSAQRSEHRRAHSARRRAERHSRAARWDAAARTRRRRRRERRRRRAQGRRLRRERPRRRRRPHGRGAGDWARPGPQRGQLAARRAPNGGRKAALGGTDNAAGCGQGGARLRRTRGCRQAGILGDRQSPPSPRSNKFPPCGRAADLGGWGERAHARVRGEGGRARSNGTYRVGLLTLTGARSPPPSLPIGVTWSEPDRIGVVFVVPASGASGLPGLFVGFVAGKIVHQRVIREDFRVEVSSKNGKQVVR